MIKRSWILVAIIILIFIFGEPIWEDVKNMASDLGLDDKIEVVEGQVVDKRIEALTATRVENIVTLDNNKKYFVTKREFEEIEINDFIEIHMKDNEIIEVKIVKR